MTNVKEIAEVVSAVSKIVKPPNTIVSRLAIETEIVENPGKYPLLHSKSQRMLRRIITESMDFSFTNQCEGNYRHKWVWDISHSPSIKISEGFSVS